MEWHALNRRRFFDCILDYILGPLLIIVVVYRRNFTYGFIDQFELGREAACINGLFHGKIPYKDIFMYFGPLNVYLEALAVKIFGNTTLTVIMGYFYFGTIITLITGYLIGRGVCRKRFFAFAIALSLIVETYDPYWATRWGGMRFGFGLLAILCAVNFFKKSNNLWSVLAGIFTSIAFLTSFDVGIFSFAAISAAFCFYVASHFEKNKILKLKGPILYLTGALIILLPFITYFISKGAFLPYVKTLIVIAKNHVKVWGQPAFNPWRGMHLSRILSFQFKYIFIVLLYFYSAFYLLSSIYKRKIYWKHYCILCLLIYGILFYKAATRAMQNVQFQIAMQPAIILGFIFLEDVFMKIVVLTRRKPVEKNRVKVVILKVIFYCMIWYVVFSEKMYYGTIKQWFLYQTYKNYAVATPIHPAPVLFSKAGLSVLEIDRAKGIMAPARQAAEIESITRYIISITRPNEAIFTFPDLCMFNFLTDRPFVGRFSLAIFAFMCDEYRLELMRSLQSQKPKYVLLGRYLSGLTQSMGSKKELLPEIAQYIKDHYILLKSFHSVDVYEIR